MYDEADNINIQPTSVSKVNNLQYRQNTAACLILQQLRGFSV